MPKLVNRAKMTTATTGTGTITLGSAVDGYQTFADAGVADTNIVSYVIEDGSNWEIGTGTYTATGTTLSRTVSESSNADAAINLSGSAVVFVTAAAADIVQPSGLATVATTGAYSDLSGTPTLYTDASVDTHLNTGTAATGEVLSWTGTDYDWIAAGGGTALELYAENPSSPTAPSATGTNAVAIGSGAVASAAESFAAGLGASASGNYSVAIGRIASATQNYTTAIGYNSDADGSSSISIGLNTTASSTYSTALGVNSGGGGSNTAIGSGAMALSGSYASGTDSFAAAIANNTSSYGATGSSSLAMGYLARATATSAIAIGNSTTASNLYATSIGYTNTASNQYSSVLGGRGNSASGRYSVVLGGSFNTSSNDYTIAGGFSSGASQDYAIAMGYNSSALRPSAVAIGTHAYSFADGKYSYAGGRFSANGDAQTGTFVLRSDTTDATPEALTTNNSTASTINQIILPNNSAYAFHGTIVARQQASAGTACAAWKIEGLIRREGSAATTVLVNSATTIIDNTPGWGMALSADTTNGGLAITVTGAAATNIRWVATIHTSEVTY